LVGQDKRETGLGGPAERMRSAAHQADRSAAVASASRAGKLSYYFVALVRQTRFAVLPASGRNRRITKFLLLSGGRIGNFRLLATEQTSVR